MSIFLEQIEEPMKEVSEHMQMVNMFDGEKVMVN